MRRWVTSEPYRVSPLNPIGFSGNRAWERTQDLGGDEVGGLLEIPTKGFINYVLGANSGSGRRQVDALPQYPNEFRV